MCFTKTWLKELKLDAVVAPDGLKLAWADRRWEESGKGKGGGASHYVKCHTRESKMPDMLYTNAKEAYTSAILPPLSRSDHNLVHLFPEHTPRVRREHAPMKTVKVWTEVRDLF